MFNAHHDGITGSESDQVYLDLLGGWREAYELAARVAARSTSHLVAAIATTGTGTNAAAEASEPAVVVNTLAWDRSEVAVLDTPAPAAGEALEVADSAGQAVPVLVEPSPVPGSVRLSFRAQDVPGVGYATFQVRRQPTPEATGSGGGSSGWEALSGTEIANEHLEIVADPARGGGLSRVADRTSGFQLVPEGDVGNELLVYPEYANHPRFGEGPWHLLPLGPPARSGSEAATVRAERSALGQRLVVEGALRGFGYRQAVTLWDGARRAELRTEVHGWAIQDHLLRLRFPTTLAGGTPVSAVGDAVVARGFGLIDVDSSEQPWTLDNPAADWFGLSTTLVVEAAEAGRSYHRRSIGVAEVVAPVGAGAAPGRARLVVALVQKGVTATCSEADHNRYGGLEGDSNLPDFRFAVGGPAQNPFVAQVLQAAGPAYRAALEDQLARQGWARLLVPAERSLREVWQPGADLRGPRDLPVIVVAGRDDASTEAAVDALSAAGCRRAGGGEATRRPGAPTRTGPRLDGGPAQPGHPGLRRRLVGRASCLAVAGLHGLAVRGLDRPAPPVRAGRVRLRARALEPRLRERFVPRARRLASGRLCGGGPGLQPAPAHQRRGRARRPAAGPRPPAQRCGLRPAGTLTGGPVTKVPAVAPYWPSSSPPAIP